MSRLGTSDCPKYCLLECGSSRLAVPATRVREVASRPQLAEIPCTADVLAGVCQLRGQFLPVLRIAPVLQRPSPSTEQHMVVIDAPANPWALLVDQVAAIEALEVSLSTDRGPDAAQSECILGTATFRGRVVHVIDVVGFYRSAEELLNRHWESSGLARCSAGRARLTTKLGRRSL